MAAEKAPAFQFYPKDFLADGKVAAMTLAERGAYITLLCLCWQEQSLPTDPARLARMVGSTPAFFHKLWDAVGPCFREVNGRYIHLRLEREREKQAAFATAQSTNGQKGARTRWHRHQLANGTAINPPMATPMAKNSSPVSDLRSPISDLRSPVRARERESTEKPRMQRPGASIAHDDGSAETTDRAAKLLERYAELFVQHRLGAKYFSRPHVDLPEAERLIAVWDDARLEKLAILVLTTDDPWIARTDRGFRIFSMKASWADDRLRAWETEHGVQVTA